MEQIILLIKFENKVVQDLNRGNLGLTTKGSVTCPALDSAPPVPPRLGLVPVTGRLCTVPVMTGSGISNLSPVNGHDVVAPQIPPRNSAVGSPSPSNQSSGTALSVDEDTVVLSPRALEQFRQDLNRRLLSQPGLNLEGQLHKVGAPNVSSDGVETERRPTVVFGSKRYRLLPQPSVQTNPPAGKPPKPYSLKHMSTTAMTELCSLNKLNKQM